MLPAELIYPECLTCIVCGDELAMRTRYCVCAKCRPVRVFDFCAVCGVKINGMKRYCDSCLTANRKFDEARGSFHYEDEQVKRLVQKFKYGNKPFLAKYLAEYIADTYYCQNWQPDVITFVPAHWIKRVFDRGYDQAELLSKSLAAILGLPQERLLKKIKYTTVNAAKLGKTDRAVMLADSFSTVGRIKGENVLLVDDVFTSGATAEECSRMLKLAGAKKVWVLTFATSKELTYTYSPDEADAKLAEFLKKRKL